ncbi:hypothetical protein R3P38DRAFT_2935142 [Favolaschia claudopus]|uniref:C2H2-type domain-containing protein n=1 Tax=Favolaschia claudopus TaxID=2862362 RepID=A0AAW0BNK3_9AGAR
MSHPIALPVAPGHQDYVMEHGSYTGENGQFNPASYTRHFLGSPISWRAGSFGAQFVPSQSPTAMLVGSFDRIKTPQDSSILNAWNVFDHHGEHCRNYTCCGIHLEDLHALLEHFEAVHIVVTDRNQPSIQIPFNPQPNPPEPEPSHLHPQPQYSTPFDTDDMDLGDADFDHNSPPPPSTAPTSAVTSRAPSPTPSPSGSSRPTLNINSVGFSFREAQAPMSSRNPAPFSAFARYNAEYNSPGSGAVTPQDVAEYASTDPSAIAPALVFATGEELQGDSGSGSGSSHPSPTTAPTGILPSPIHTHAHTSTSSKMSHSSSSSSKSSSKRSPPPLSTSTSAPPSRGATPGGTPLPTPPSSATASPAPATILLPHKPFRCPKPNCSKSYKQANGLKYHMTHGSCNFGPAKDVEAVKALLERKRAVAHANANAHVVVPEEEAEEVAPAQVAAVPAGGDQQLSRAELDEVEARVRPFACGIGDCTRRYKNMNGLRYHYQHSGDHGALGLSQLAAGVHPCLQQGRGGHAAAAATPVASTSGAPSVAVNGGKAAASTGTYAWGSTLLPHIQAVATTSTSSATATASTSSSSSSTAAQKSAAAAAAKGKPEATPFTPPSSASTQAQGQGQFAGAPQAQNDYLAHLQRAQFAQYHQWYAQTHTQQQQQQAQQQVQQQQVDVQMG